MAYRVTTEGYSAFFREEEDGRGSVLDDMDDGYTCALCNTSYEKDLQLAAELGKTLLERNKELEAVLRQHQNIVDDQAQEIEYLRKQTAALREVNDSRLRIYEQLEVSIQDLEHANHRLATQATTDKKHIASLENQVEKLESRCEELQRRNEEREKWREESLSGSGGRGREQNGECGVGPALREELAEVKSKNSRLVSKLRELQETIDTVTQENMRLEERVVSLQHRQEEISLQEQVSEGKVCRRCLRPQEEVSLMGDDDNMSVIDSLINSDQIKEYLGEPGNPYRTLVEKYEALLKVQRYPGGVVRPHTASEPTCLSLQEELQMSGEFSSFSHREEEGDSESEVAQPVAKTTPTDFSETETSSGFSDETINKGTQTEAHVPPGAFLCSITDGDDCKFSIYDEANAVESRFRKTPKYRQLFREIFEVLSRAAEAKDEGESLPLLEDMTPIKEQAPKAPPVTPAHEEPPQQPKKDVLECLGQGLGTGKKHRGRRQKSVENKARRKKEGGGGSWKCGTPERRQPLQEEPTQQPPPPVWFSPAPSSAAHEVAKLRQLEKSYAEVLRLGRQHLNKK